MKLFQSNHTIRYTLLLPLLLLVIPITVLAQSPTHAENLRAIAHIAAEGADAANAGDTAKAAAEYEELHELWESFEDDFRDAQPNAYLEMEDKMHAVRDTLQANPIPGGDLYAAFEALEHESVEIATLISGQNGNPANAAPGSDATPASFLQDLTGIQQMLSQGDTATAIAAFNQARFDWLGIEGDIATRSAEAYSTIETALGDANAALNASPPQTDAAITAIEDIRQVLTPLTAATTRYSIFDASAIILREGLEALLVLVALLAFLQRTGNQAKRGWIWAGAGAGIFASIGTAFVLQAIFSRAAAGQNREIIEGVTGLVAAGLLFYVSYWLHSKSHVQSWQKYLDRQTSQALARGSMFGLAALAFLAVFREGAETTVFYLGMASSIALNDLLWGLAIGSGVLIVVAILILRLGVHLPMRPFFLAAGLLVYYLGFKFLGTGIHALQLAGVFPASPVEFLRAVPFIGLYPTWEVVIAQAGLLMAAIVVVAIVRQQNSSPTLRTQ